MPKFPVNGVEIYYEVHGEGFPLLWSHEFAGDYSSWEPQVNFFSRRYQVITYSARGYLPSDIPHVPTDYSQEQSVEDVRTLMERLNIEQAYIGGLSMGGNVALNFALTYPAMAKAIIVASAGSGSDNPEQFREEGDQLAVRLLREGMAPVANDYARGPARVQFLISEDDDPNITGGYEVKLDLRSIDDYIFGVSAYDDAGNESIVATVESPSR